MAAPPLRTEISDVSPNPTNAVARTGFGKLWDYVTGLLGATGDAPEARVALGFPAITGGDMGKALVVDAAGAGHALVEGALSGRNRLINGSFVVNQRGVSGTVVLTAGQYGHDRWKAGASGCTYAFASSGGVTTLTISAGSLQQVIEGQNLQTGTHVLSWSGTAQGKIGAGSFAASGVAGSVTGGTNLTIEFGTGTLALPQLELGAIPTPFEHRSVGQITADCKRYYERMGRGLVGGTASSTVATLSGRFTVDKRAAPTFTQIQSGFNLRVSGSTGVVSGTLSSNGIDAIGASLSFTRSSGTFAAVGLAVDVNDGVVAAFDAEL